MTAYLSPALIFSVASHFAMKHSAPCSTVLRHFPSSWAAAVRWSALIPKALKSSKNYPIHYFSCPPTQPAPPPLLRASRTSAVSYILHACHKTREQGPPPAYSRLDALISRLGKRVQKEIRVVGTIVLAPTDAASQEDVVGSAQRAVVARARARRHAAVQHCLEYLSS